MGRKLCLLAAPLALAACDVPVDGRCGTYVDTPGTARIVSVDPAPPDQMSCANAPVRVLFDFTPTDPGAAGLAASGVRLTISSGYDPPSTWVTSSGLTVGSEHPAVRSDQPVGPCPPLEFRLTDIDLMAGIAACL